MIGQFRVVFTEFHEPVNHALMFQCRGFIPVSRKCNNGVCAFFPAGVGEILTDPSVIKSGEKGSEHYTQ